MISTIVQRSARAITYWDLLLDRRNAALAEGSTCESYLDTGNRQAIDDPPSGTLVKSSPATRR